MHHPSYLLNYEQRLPFHVRVVLLQLVCKPVSHLFALHEVSMCTLRQLRVDITWGWVLVRSRRFLEKGLHRITLAERFTRANKRRTISCSRRALKAASLNQSPIVNLGWLSGGVPR